MRTRILIRTLVAIRRELATDDPGTERRSILRDRAERIARELNDAKR